MTTPIRWAAVGAAAVWLATAGCRDQDRERTAQGAGTGAGPTASADKEEKTVTGRVVRATHDELVLKEEGRDEDLKLKVDPNTQVTIAGRPASVSALKEGAQVRASYDESQKVTMIEAQESAESGASRTGPAGAPGSSGVDTPSTSPSGSGTSSESPGSSGSSETSPKR